MRFRASLLHVPGTAFPSCCLQTAVSLPDYFSGSLLALLPLTCLPFTCLENCYPAESPHSAALCSLAQKPSAVCTIPWRELREPSRALPRLSTARLSPWPSLALFSPKSSPQGLVHHRKVPHVSCFHPCPCCPVFGFLFLLCSPSVMSDSKTPMDCSPPGSSVRGISQARVLNQVAISSSGGSSPPRDQTHVCCVSCIGR